MNVCGVYYTNSMKDELAVGPVHSITTKDGVEMTLCGKRISGPRWFYTYEKPTCKKCDRALRIVMVDRPKEGE